MTKSILFSMALLMSSLPALAREPKATLCGDKSEKAARALYQINNPGVKFSSSLELIQMNHGEGGLEVWNVHFFDRRGHETSAPYQIKAVIDDCVVFEFTMPTAG